MDVFRNEILIVSIFSWAAAQVIKTVIHAIMYKGIDWKRLVGDGGMPSAHSATVVSLTVGVGIRYGLTTPLFAVSLIFSIIVMHDAMGVRREAGRHAKALNEIFEYINMENSDPDVALKEFLGHSPLQVVFGALLGFAIAAFYFYI
ncbi:MAG: divergent PAP2 family protein [Lachnospiraceae bacterium]|nr:divergent PAP2 family protein [Lachnospiraceae bacterium]